MAGRLDRYRTDRSLIEACDSIGHRLQRYSPMHKEHDVFEPPPSENCSIWRYMDLEKYIALIHSRALYFRRADAFDDPFEGSLSLATIELRKNSPMAGHVMQASDGRIEPYEQSAARFARTSRSHSFVNCWHLSEHESAAMWKMYCQTSNGIAVRSSYKRLTSCFATTERAVYVGKVKYVDYDSTVIPTGNTLHAIMHKRLSFRHEHELRAVVLWDGVNEPGDLWRTPDQVGLSVPVDLEGLIESVFVSPSSPPWFGEVVSSVSEKFCIQRPVQNSRLSDRPLF